MWKVSRKGRTYEQGKALSNDTRRSIIDKIISRGGQKETGIFPGKYMDVAGELDLSSAVVSKIWKQYCQTSSISPLKKHTGNPSSLSDGDLQLIEVMKIQKPSTSYTEILDTLFDVGDLPTGSTSRTSVCNAVRNRLPSGPFTYKKITHVAQEWFTLTNMAYTQLYVDYLHGKDPNTLQYFDECGVKLPTNCTRSYGHSLIGQRAVELHRYCETANMTVNVLCSLSGVTYMNTIDGPSNTTEFLRFFEEAYNSVNPNTGRLSLEVVDTIVMDNCPFHHNDGERMLREFLEDLNIELVFMPAYSPDFNPTEYVFGKMKCLLKHRLWHLANTDLRQSLYEVIRFITSGDMHGFFQITGYLDP